MRNRIFALIGSVDRALSPGKLAPCVTRPTQLSDCVLATTTSPGLSLDEIRGGARGARALDASARFAPERCDRARNVQRCREGEAELVLDVPSGVAQTPLEGGVSS
jgi:hypothetical protein